VRRGDELAARSIGQLMLHQREATMNIYWKNPPLNLDFTSAGNWVQNAVPGAGDIAELTPPGVTAIVSAASPVTVLGVNIGSATLGIIEGNFTAAEGMPMGAANRGFIAVEGGGFSVGGTLNNPGTVVVQNAGTLAVDGFDLTVKGGGSVQLSAAGILVAAGRTLSNVNNTIGGDGAISGAGTFVNQSGGFIQTSGVLTLDIATRNQGTIETTTIGPVNFLQINGSVINNTGGGVILAVSNTAVLVGSDTSIIGGTVTVDSSGTVLITGTNVTFDGGKSVVPTNAMITINGNVELNSGTALNLRGTINNSGSIAALGSATLVAQPSGTSSTVTLKGSGSIDLDVDDAQITGGGSVVTLDNVNNKIFGGGRIGGAGLKLKNEVGAIIDANDGTLIIDTGSNTVINVGALNAGGGTLVIASNLSNTGKLNADDGMIYIAANATGGTATISGLSSDVALEFGAAASTATKFAAGTTGQLILADSAQYTGVISGFGSNTTQSIDLADFNIAGAHKVSFSSGVLTLQNTAGQVVHLHFSGAYTLASFLLSDDGNFNGTFDGTKIVDPPVPTKPQTPLTNPLASLFGQFMASWNPITALTSEVQHSPLASELQTILSLPHAHG
jgi:hypothetical protein